MNASSKPSSSKAKSKKTVVITGGSEGIGLALCNQFADAGFSVITCGTRRKKFENQNILYTTLDITHPFQVETWLSDLNKIDILINNAGVLGERGVMLENAIAEWTRVQKINVNGPFFVLKAAKDKLRSESVVINISSSVGRKARAGWGAYSVSKVALEALTEILAAEHPEWICFSVNPGGTATPMRALAFPEEDPTTLPESKKIASVIFDWAMHPIGLHGQQLNCRDELLLT